MDHDKASYLHTSSQNTPRFYILKRNDGTFHTMSPFLIHSSLTASVGNIKSVKKLRSGDLLVEVQTAAQAHLLSEIETLGNVPISVVPHGYLNTSRGVISESDLLHTSEEEILENLRSQSVSAVRRITIRRNGTTISTKHLILTFDSHVRPSFIIAGYLRCPVRPYVQNPLRCFQCQRFGHSKASCRSSPTCARCAQPDHSPENCTSPERCMNCKGNHASYSRSCPKWIIEKEIQALRAHENITYMEARKQVEARTPIVGVSYASATSSKKTMHSVSTQTETNSSHKTSDNKPAKIPPAQKSHSTGTTKPSENKTLKTHSTPKDSPHNKIPRSGISSISKPSLQKKLKRKDTLKNIHSSHKVKDPRNSARKKGSHRLSSFSSDLSENDAAVPMDTFHHQHSSLSTSLTQ